ncbi:uncharacterized protein F5891DRAFT_1023983, partial [Suillus fuscotomentosus]
SEKYPQLKSELEMLMEWLKELNTYFYRPALETFRTLMRKCTSSMTSISKATQVSTPTLFRPAGAVRDMARIRKQ